MSEPYVSVVIPVFNGGLYIARCIDSILSQSFVAYEVIVVDDCSVDNTRDVVREYCSCNKNIKLIERNKNSGGGRLPRFDGILSSNGKFVCPVDADDTLERDYIKKLVQRQRETQADIVLGRMVICSSTGSLTGRMIPEVDYDMDEFFSGTEAVKHTCRSFEIALAGMLCETSLYKECIREFNSGYDCDAFSDELDQRRLLLKAKRVSMVDARYFYWQVSSSIVHTKSVNLERVLHIRRVFDFFLQEFRDDPKIKHDITENSLESLYRLCQAHCVRASIQSIKMLKDAHAYIVKNCNTSIRSRFRFFSVMFLFACASVFLAKLRMKIGCK